MVLTEQRVTRYLREDEMEAFLDVIENARDYLLARLMLFQGLRISEVLGLSVNNVDLKNSIVTIHGKGNKWREVPLDDETRRILRIYLRDNDLTYHKTIFKISQRSVRYMVEIAGKRAGITRIHVHPHMLRHTCATRLKLMGMEDMDLADWLGHSNIQITRQYYGNSGVQLRETYQHLQERRNGGSLYW